MTKYVFLLLSLFIFLGCAPPSSSTSSEGDDHEFVDDTNDDNIDYTTDIDYSSDTVVNENVAQVPHTKASIPMLGILLGYDNQTITSTDATWSAKLFGTSDHELNHYYAEASHSNFQFAKATEGSGTVDDGIASVSLSKDHPDTDIDDFNAFNSNVLPDLKAALESLDSVIDFSSYDTDNNGHITPDELLLTFIVAGYEDSYAGGHVTNGVWGHQYCTDTASTPTLDGVTLMGCIDSGNYAMFGELHYDAYYDQDGPHDATIGIIAHELGHSAFSLPDLYNTSNTNSGGIGYFGLMGAGAWTRIDSNEYYGNTPTHFTAWSKVYMQWITPTQSNGYASLNETASDSYNIVKIPISANHYYLLENRNSSGYDRGLYSLTGDFDGGMAIWHINQNNLTTSNFFNNNVNSNTLDKGVDLVEAVDTDIDDGYGGGGKALFYSPHATTFSQNTNISDISTRGSTMSLNIN